MCSLCARNLFLAGRNGERGPRESAARCPYTYCHGIFQVRQPVADVSRPLRRLCLPLLASSHPAHCCRDSLVFGSILHRLDASVRVRCRGASALGTSARGCQEPAKRDSKKHSPPILSGKISNWRLGHRRADWMDGALSLYMLGRKYSIRRQVHREGRKERKEFNLLFFTSRPWRSWR